jgi:hypothetical protein
MTPNAVSHTDTARESGPMRAGLPAASASVRAFAIARSIRKRERRAATSAISTRKARLALPGSLERKGATS